MDPLMRKLFQPREAREKLRGMGGIMSSSPQLASTVAKFNVGGPVPRLGMPSDPDAPLPTASRARATRVGDRTFVLTDDGRVLDAQTGAPAAPEVAAEVMRKLSPQLSMMDIVVAEPEYGMGGVNPSFREDTSGQLPPMPSDLAPMSEPADPTAGLYTRSYNLGPADEPRTGRPLTADTHSADLRAAIEAAQAGGSSVDATGGGSGRFSLSNVGPNLETLTAPFIGADRDAEIAQIEAQLGDPNLTTFEREALETRLMGLRPIPYTEGVVDAVTDFGGRVLRTPGNLVGQGLSLFGATDAGAAVSEFFDPEYYDANSPRYRGALRPASAETSTAPVADAEPSVAEPTAETSTAPVAVADAEPSVAETTAETPAAPTIDVDLDDPRTYDTDFDEMMRRLGGATGKEDKGSRQKAMADLAMIGLAIAAGQSPDALTNIAQGALTGMQAIRAEGAAKEAVEAETRALAAKLATDREIARMRLPSGGGTYTPERLYQQNLNAILANPDMFDVFTGDAVDPVKARNLAMELSRRGESLPAAGRIVEQDGVRYQEQPDGTFQQLES